MSLLFYLLYANLYAFLLRKKKKKEKKARIKIKTEESFQLVSLTFRNVKKEKKRRGTI